MSKTRQDFTAANREAWNEAAPIHEAQNQEKLKAAFATPGYCDLDDHLIEALKIAGVEGKSVAQLCCNNGRDLLSVKNLGAGTCLGVDGAELFIEQARELARAAGHEDSVTFLASDIYNLPADLDGRFDIVMTTVGVYSWMPDLPFFFAALARLIKPGGHLVTEEMHPVLFMYEEGRDGAPSALADSYFRKEPWIETTGLDYYEGGTYESKPNYSFQHRLDEILMAGINNGLNLRYFRELNYDISYFCADLEQAKANPPQGYTMVMEKRV